MKDSTFYFLPLAYLSLHLVQASVSASVDKNTLPVLVDTANNAETVQLRNPSALIHSVFNKTQAPKTSQQISEQFERLLDKGRYNEIITLGDAMSDEELLGHILSKSTTVDHCKGLRGYLEQRKLLPSFLVLGSMMLIRKVIVGSKDHQSKYHIEDGHLFDAIALSLEEDQHTRVTGLLEAVQERHAKEDEQSEQAGRYTKFELFMCKYFERHAPEENSTPLKRFLTLHIGEFREKNRGIVKAICVSLGWTLSEKFPVPNTKKLKLLKDLVGQPFLLTPTALARGFLARDYDVYRERFVKFGWQEAIIEGLKAKYRYGGESLWNVMVREYPHCFSGKYPSTNNARRIALEDYSAKQDFEANWAEVNAPNLQRKLEKFVPGLFPENPLRIISEYAVTWIAFLRSPPKRQSAHPMSPHIPGQLRKLMDVGGYEEVIELCDGMTKDERAKHLFPLITNIEHCRYLNGYMECRGMLLSFLMHANMDLVRMAILEFEDIDSDDYINPDHICDAIFLSLHKDKHDRVIALLEAVQGKFAKVDDHSRGNEDFSEFENFVYNLFDRHSPEKNDTSLKRFLTLRGEEFKEKHANVFEVFCERLVDQLQLSFSSASSAKLLADFVRQPSLLTPAIFAKALLIFGDDSDQDSFIRCAWREAIEEGLKKAYSGGGKMLWEEILKTLPTSFPKTYPPSAKVRTAVLKRFKTKSVVETEWAEENAPSLRVKLEEFVPGLFPPVPLTIISEYAITWISVPPSLLQKHSINVKAQESVPGMLNKLQSGETRLDDTAAQPKAVQKVVDNVTKPLSTKRQPLEDIVDYSGLSSIDPYDDNPDTKYYLSLGCHYLAKNHSTKYETESVRKKQGLAYYSNCLHAVWPRSSLEALPANECHLKKFGSFTKGDVPGHSNKQPSFVAREDGFMLQWNTDYSWIIYYHKDKPSMNLDVLSRLQWPHSRDLLPFTDTSIRTSFAELRKEQSNQFNATIKLDSKHAESTTFADLKRWVQCFDLSRYDPARLKSFREQLSLKYPNTCLTKIYKLGTRTNVEPAYNSFVLIPPGATIALRYDPEVFTTFPENVTSPQYSTIITDFEHQGSKYCLLLSFDVLTE